MCCDFFVFQRKQALYMCREQPLLIKANSHCFVIVCMMPWYFDTVLQTRFLLGRKESCNWKLGEQRWVVEIIRFVVDWMYVLDLILHHDGKQNSRRSRRQLSKQAFIQWNSVLHLNPGCSCHSLFYKLWASCSAFPLVSFSPAPCVSSSLICIAFPSCLLRELS